MSAIAGVVHSDGRPVVAALPLAMARATPRPISDGRSVWADGVAGLARIRHATTPEALGEGDLMPDPGSGAILCFDGRLDNRAELLDLLGERGRTLQPAPDGALVEALFARMGNDALIRLAGDFALALWQPRERRLLCARSATGWRPLHWTCDGRCFAFATEPAAIVRGLGLTPRVNEALAGEILSARFVSPDETLWEGIQRLQPGAAVEFRNGTVRRWHWYDERYDDHSRLSDAEHVEIFRSLFDQALVACARSDRAVAAHLSGGLDSSSVLARAVRLHRAGAIAVPVGAISARYPGAPHDESEWSGAVERDLGVSARIVGDLAFDPDAAAQWCADTLHLPVRPNAMGPTLTAGAAMRAAGERVLLTGEGGDDWMQGSRAHWPDLLRTGRWGQLAREGRGYAPDATALQKLRWLASASGGPLLNRRRREALVRPFLAFGADVPEWLRGDWARQIGLADRWHEGVAADRRGGFAQMARRAMIAPPHRDLIFAPIQSAAAQFGVEQRHPFHDLRLVRFFMGAAGDMFRRDGVRKYLLREAMRGDLPENVRTRKGKAQFSAPIVDAMIRFFERKAPGDMTVARLGWVDPAAVERLFEPFRRARHTGEPIPVPAGALHGLWFCVAVDLWLDNGTGS